MRLRNTRSGPTLRQLELFEALASSDGIASAGSKLGMTPSATSHALRALEETLGTAVIDRNSPGVALTFAGEQILPLVRDVFAALESIQSTTKASAGLKTGLLRVGSFGASSSLTMLPPLLTTFRSRYPGVDVFVTEKTDPQIEQELIERRIEIGFVTLPKPQFDTLSLATDDLAAVVPSDHELAASDPVSVHDLARHPLVLTHAGSQDLVLHMFERTRLRPTVAHELQQLVSILEFVARGHGIAVVASLALPDEHPGVLYRRITPRASRQVGLACLNERRLSPAAAAFWELVRAEHWIGA